MTEKIFYREPKRTTSRSTILQIRVERENVGLSLPETIFFPEGGGQPSDQGFIWGQGWTMRVEKVQEDGTIWHWGKIVGQGPQIGEEIVMEIDPEWRWEICQQHTAQHLFSAILEKDYGFATTGFSILKEWVKIEIPCQHELSSTMVQEAEAKTRFFIRQRLPVNIFWENEERRIVEIPSLDFNPCGGLHVTDTGFIGCFAVLRFYRKNRDFWRIEFVAGERVTRILQETVRITDDLRKILGRDLLQEAVRCLQKGENLEKEVRHLKEELLETRIKLLKNYVQETPKGKILRQALPYNFEELRLLAKKVGEKNVSCILWNEKGEVATFSTSPSLGEKLTLLLRECGFRGHSTPTFSQGRIENLSLFQEQIGKI